MECALDCAFCVSNIEYVGGFDIRSLWVRKLLHKNMKCNNILFKNKLVLQAISCVHFSVFCCELLIGRKVRSVFTNTCLIGCVCLTVGIHFT